MFIHILCKNYEHNLTKTSMAYVENVCQFGIIMNFLLLHITIYDKKNFISDDDNLINDVFHYVL